MYIYTHIYIYNLEVKLPTIQTDGKNKGVKSPRGEQKKWEDQRKREKKEDAGAWKGRKVAIHCVFPMICGSGGSKSRLAGAAPSGQMRDEKLHAVVALSTFWSKKGKNTSRLERFWKLSCGKSARRCGAKHVSKSKCIKHTMFGPLSEVELWKNAQPLFREAHVQVKMYKARQLRTTFGSWDIEKVHTVVARSTFPSQNIQNTPASDHFWKLRCRKSASRCGAKHMSKSKCTKHVSFGALLEVKMSKKCTEAHFQVKMYKARQLRTTFGSWDVEKVHTVVARSTFPSQNIQDTPASDHFWKLRCRKSAHCCGAKHISKSKYTRHASFGPLLEVDMSKKCTPLWREAHFRVKRVKKKQGFWAFFDVPVSRCRKSAHWLTKLT